MKKVTLFFIAFLCIVASRTFADPAEGYWYAVDDDDNSIYASWHIYVEGDTLYGKLVHVYDEPDSPVDSNTAIASACKPSYKGFPLECDVSTMPIIGTPFIFGLKNISEGKWGKGNIIDPETGKMYTCSITYREPDGKKIKETIVEMRASLGPFGLTEKWLKTTEEGAKSETPLR